MLCIESTIWWPKGVPIKRAAKTIILHRCDVENCEDTSETMVVSLMLPTGVEEVCYEHIPPEKSGKDNQLIQLKRMLIKESVSTL